GNIVTINTTSAHGFSVGQTVVLSGVANAGYNGVFVIASTPTATQFTFVDPTTGLAASSGGTATVAGLTFNGLVNRSVAATLLLNNTTAINGLMNGGPNALTLSGTPIASGNNVLAATGTLALNMVDISTNTVTVNGGTLRLGGLLGS